MDATGPALGRYVQSDPVGLAGGVNTYGYVMQNPLGSIDPMGSCGNSISSALDSSENAFLNWANTSPVMQYIADNPNGGFYLMGAGATFLGAGAFIAWIDASAATGIATADSAANAMNGVRLAQQLSAESKLASAESMFDEAGGLSQQALVRSRQIVPAGDLENSAIPQGFANRRNILRVGLPVLTAISDWKMKVRCIRIFDARGNSVDQSPWLTIGKVYLVLAVSFGTEPGPSLRLIGDGENGVALFRLNEFEVVSSIIPPTWIIFPGPKSIVQLAPQPWTPPGYWERYYDRDPGAVRTFEEEAKKIVEADS